MSSSIRRRINDLGRQQWGEYVMRPIRCTYPRHQRLQWWRKEFGTRRQRR